MPAHTCTHTLSRIQCNAAHGRHLEVLARVDPHEEGRPAAEQQSSGLFEEHRPRQGLEHLGGAP